MQKIQNWQIWQAGKCRWMAGLPSATGVGNGRATSLEASAPPHPLTFTNTGKYYQSMIHSGVGARGSHLKTI